MLAWRSRRCDRTRTNRWLNNRFNKVQEICTWAVVLASESEPDNGSVRLAPDFAHRVPPISVLSSDQEILTRLSVQGHGQVWHSVPFFTDREGRCLRAADDLSKNEQIENARVRSDNLHFQSRRRRYLPYHQVLRPCQTGYDP